MSSKTVVLTVALTLLIIHEEPHDAVCTAKLEGGTHRKSRQQRTRRSNIYRSKLP
jgi:hypothetical protein